LRWLASLHPGLADWQQMLSSAGALYAQGLHLDRRAMDQEYAQCRPELLSTLLSEPEKAWASAECSAHLLTLSAQSEAALHDLARRYQAFLAQPSELSLGDICATAQLGLERKTKSQLRKPDWR
jgi:acyl transferase domain-containing protein